MKKKVLCALISATMVMSLVTGCGGSKTEESAGAEGGEASAEPVKMVVQLDTFMDDYPEVKQAMEEIQAMDKYANVEWEFIDKDPDYATTMPIAISGGEQRDILAVTDPMLQQQWADVGVIQPLDEFVEATGDDWAKEFGQYEANGIKNDQYFIIPNKVNQWVLFYNKQIFDDANIEYPDANAPMTWDEYRTLAKDLTSGDGADKKYGALQINWGAYWYGPAIMELGGGQHFYNEEGLSNIEDPAFANALKLRYEMMEVDQSIPTYANVATSKMGADAFMNGQYGMSYQGAWLWAWLIDKENHPRDWKVGIAPMPVDEGEEMKTWGSVNGFCVGATSANPQLAYEISMDLSRLSTKYSTSSVGVNMTVDQADLYANVAEGLTEDDITREDILHLTQNPEIEYITEKILGPNNVAYEKVINEEIEMYFVGEQSLEDAIAHIKERGDVAIQE